MWREKTGATDNRFPDKNIQKELIFRANSKCQSSNVKIKVKVEVEAKRFPF
jgi:hypothetical protein